MTPTPIEVAVLRRSRPSRLLRRSAAAGAVALLAVGALSLAVSPAQAVPEPPTITSPAVSIDTLGPDIAFAGDLATASGYDYARVQLFAGNTLVDECYESLGPGAETFACVIAAPAPGVYTAVAQHSDVAEPGEGDWSADSNSVTVRVGSTDPVVLDVAPGTPEPFSHEWVDRSPTVSGTGPHFGEVTVNVRYNLGEGDVVAPYCTATVEANGTWACTGSPVPAYGYVYFESSAIDLLSGAVAGDDIGGDLFGETITVQIDLAAAGFTAQLIGDADATVFGELYQVEVIPGEPYQYNAPVDQCPEDLGEGTDIGPTASCTWSALAPGIWNLYSTQYVNDTIAPWQDDYVLIPAAPTGFEADVDGQTVRFSGLGTPGFRVEVRAVSGGGGCSTTVSSNSRWSCSTELEPGTQSFRAVQRSVGFVADPGSGEGEGGEGAAAPASLRLEATPAEIPSIRSFQGYSARTAPVAVTVEAPVPPVQNVARTPIDWQLTGVPLGPLTPGLSFELSGTGLPAGATIDVELQSTPRPLGSTVVDESGAFVLPVTVPLDMEPGDHSLVATLTPLDGEPSVVSVPVVVEPVAAPEPIDGEVTEEEEEAVDGENPEGASGGLMGTRADAGAPSAITSTLPTMLEAFANGTAVLLSGGIALALLVLVAFPAELLNSTLASNTGRFGRGFARLADATDRATQAVVAATRTTAVPALVLVLISSIIFGFVDPEYGFDPVSLRMTLSLALGLFLVSWVAVSLTRSVLRRVWGLESATGLMPVALIFAVLGVVLARIVDFSPGFLLGLVIGVEAAARWTGVDRARAALTQTGVVVGLAVLAWISYSGLTALWGAEPTGFAELLVLDALVATTAEGLTAAAAGLLPLGFLLGHDLFRWSKVAWAGVFVGVTLLFSLVVLPTVDISGTPAQVGFWVLVMLVFAVVALALWALLQWLERRESRRVADEKRADSVR